MVRVSEQHSFTGELGVRCASRLQSEPGNGVLNDDGEYGATHLLRMVESSMYTVHGKDEADHKSLVVHSQRWKETEVKEFRVQRVPIRAGYQRQPETTLNPLRHLRQTSTGVSTTE